MTTITVVRPGELDQHGDPVDPDAEPETHTVEDCVIAPRSDREDATRGETVIVGLTLYAPFGADIRATDQVVLGTPWSDTFDVVGEPGHWKNPFTHREAGVEVALVRHG